MNDLLVRNGFVVDGSGSPGAYADVGVREGRISEVGAPGTLSGSSVLDVDGLVVAPGFIDVHTHYDAQLHWDPAATPSIKHGVTTVIGGNCGFSLAPISESAADYLVPMLSVVEGIPEDALRAGLTIAWESFGDFLDQLDGKTAINAGFLVGHSAVRSTVMGDEAVGAEATEPSVAAMVELVARSLAAGALGFSTSLAETHVDHEGSPVPSRHASLRELLALARVVGEYPGTSLEAIPTTDAVFGSSAHLLLTSMSVAARRTVNWNALTLQHSPAERSSRLEASDVAAAAGGVVVGLAPCDVIRNRFALDQPFLWNSIPGWADTMNLPLAERRIAFCDPSTRERLRESARESSLPHVYWRDYTLNDATNPSLADRVGRSIDEMATSQGADPFDIFCDVSVADDLKAGWSPPTIGDDDVGWEERVQLLRDPRVVVGASDAGAHLNIISTFAMYTGFLASAVRERALISLEEAVSLLTARPAALYGLHERGRLEVGAAADIVVFDPDTVGHTRPTLRATLPGGADQVECDAQGIEAVIVNGRITVKAGSLTGETSGRTLRSGRDTRTPKGLSSVGSRQ